MTLDQLLAAINDGSMLPPEVYSELDLDTILDNRDSNEAFEQSWLLASAEISQRWDVAPHHREKEILVETIRKQSFMQVSDATHQHEIASSVSDDFELIAKAIALNLKNVFVTHMFECYCKHHVFLP